MIEKTMRISTKIEKWGFVRRSFSVGYAEGCASTDRGHGCVGTVSTGVLTGSAFQLSGVVVAGAAWSPGRVHLRTVPLRI